MSDRHVMRARGTVSLAGERARREMNSPNPSALLDGGFAFDGLSLGMVASPGAHQPLRSRLAGSWCASLVVSLVLGDDSGLFGMLDVSVGYV